MTCRGMCEQCPVRPDVHADAVFLCCGEILACVRESKSCAGAAQFHGIDEVASWEIPDSYNRIRRCGDNPTAVIGESEVNGLDL